MSTRPFWNWFSVREEKGPPDPRLTGAAAAGMYLLVLALSMFFAASIVAYLVIRAMHQPWPPPGFPALPRSLWLSTLGIVLSSFTIQGALRAARRNDQRRLCRDLAATLVLGFAFLVLQAFAWIQVFLQIAQPEGPYVKLFYVLTGLHAVHVIGGLGPLVAVTHRAFAGRYSTSVHPGVSYSTIYWHFLDAIWCSLFVVIYLL
jgi:cytochrome c oxidase subunit III